MKPTVKVNAPPIFRQYLWQKRAETGKTLGKIMEEMAHEGLKERRRIKRKNEPIFPRW